ncbi:MAG: hypothetical protein NVSMB17_03700 [Candidatus Dormibacteria bacterium]
MLLAAWQALTNLRLNRMVRHYRRLGRGAGEAKLDILLERMMERSELESREIQALRDKLLALGAEVQSHVQRVGIVRYNAFDDTGGDQSFAVAMLDAQGNGAIFNGLYHRKDCRVYAKPVRDWRSTYSMSDEEQEAIRKARDGVLV